MKHYQLTEATACRFHELTKVEIIVWCFIKASDPFCSAPVPGPTAIARAVGLDKGGVSKAMKTLKSKGWIVDAGQQGVDDGQRNVDAGQQNVDAHQQKVDAGQRNVDAGQLSTAETRSVPTSQESPDLKDLKQEKIRKEEPEVKVFSVKQPNSQRPILRHQRRSPGPGPSIAAEILARGVTGTDTDPWPKLETKPAPMPDTTAQRLAAKWNIPALRHQVKAECARLNIPCTEDGPQLQPKPDELAGILNQGYRIESEGRKYLRLRDAENKLYAFERSTGKLRPMPRKPWEVDEQAV